MKRVFAVLLSICLLASLAAPALAAPIKTSGAASTLKLESVDGTAQLKNASGKEVKTTKGSRLYNGYKLATEKASYAFVSLDDTKAIKLDASSSSEVFQSGKKLELKVTSGQMFFNVTAPLKSDESLNIRTSTMVTGVRGTSGWVSVIDRYTTQISLLEGTLTITSTDPLTGQQRTITIVGGQTATIVYHGKDKNYESEIIIEDKTIQDLIEDGTIRDEHIVLEETGLTVENLQEEDVPGFVAVEVKKDKELQKKIEEKSPLSVPAIIGNAEERLEKEEAAAEAADKAIQEEFEKLTADDVDPLFEAETPSGGGGGSSVPTYNLTVTKQFRDANGINTVRQNEVTSQNLPQDGEYSISLVPPAGYSFYSISGDNNATTTNDTFTGIMDTNKNILIDYRSLTAIHLMSPTVTQVNDAYNNDGYTTVYVTGTISIDQNNPNDTRIDLASGNELRFTGSAHSLGTDVFLNTVENSIVVVEQDTFTNYGTIVGQGTMTVESGATLNNQGTLQIESENSLHIQGDLINNSTIDVGTEAGNGLLSVEGTGTFTNAGTLTIAEGSSMALKSNSTLTNNGTILVNGTITSAVDTTITNNNTFQLFTAPAAIDADSEEMVAAAIETATETCVLHGTFINNADSADEPSTIYIGDSYEDGSASAYGGVTFAGPVTNNGVISVAQSSSLLISTTGMFTDATDSSINTRGNIRNEGTMTVSGSVYGSFAVEGVTPCVIENIGKLTVNGGSVVLEEGSGCAILAAGGTVTLSNGSITGTEYGISSPTDSGGIININGGTVSGNTAIAVSGAVNMSAGTVNGSYAGIMDNGSSGAIISVTGGTISVTGDGAAGIRSDNSAAVISVSAPAQINAASSTAGGEAYGIVNSCTSYNSGEYCSITINGGTPYIPTDNQNTFAVDDPPITAKTADIIFMLQS